ASAAASGAGGASFTCFAFAGRLVCFLPTVVFFAASPVSNPAATRIFCTGSVGCAPLESQRFTRSSLRLIVDGSLRGSYVPISSIKRPLRGDRESAATTRYVGCFVLPIRIRRSLTGI